MGVVSLSELADSNEDRISDAHELSIMVFDPESRRRRQLMSLLNGCEIGSVQQAASYLPQGDDGIWLAERGIDIVMVGVDSDLEIAFQTVEAICAIHSLTVMVYSELADHDLLMRSMRTGARECFKYPIERGDLERAIGRAAARTRALAEKSKGYGKLFLFLGAKGGVGVTTLATNFSVGLGKETGKRVLLVDLDLPLGDAALDLGIQPQYSTVDALVNAGRLDSAFLQRLLVRHPSGISVLAAPGTHTRVAAPEPAVQKLLGVARQDFEYVVVDAGSTSGLVESLLFQLATGIYLVTQIGVPELRNANRLITGGLSACASKVEIVINRSSAISLGMDESSIEKALTRSPDWRIPNDYAVVRKMQCSSTPLALEDGPIGQLIRKMARKAAGLPTEPERKKKFSIFG